MGTGLRPSRRLQVVEGSGPKPASSSHRLSSFKAPYHPMPSQNRTATWKVYNLCRPRRRWSLLLSSLPHFESPQSMQSFGVLSPRLREGCVEDMSNAPVLRTQHPAQRFTSLGLSALMFGVRTPTLTRLPRGP